jgi:hypothetical protein
MLDAEFEGASVARHAPSLQALGDLVRAIVRLGGYLARSSDGPPGAECLWRGLQQMYPVAMALRNQQVETCV